MAREPLVDERVVRRQQIEDAAVLAQMLSKKSSVSRRSACRSAVVEVREIARNRGRSGRQIAQLEPLPGEVARRSASERASASIRRTCRSSTPASLELAATRPDRAASSSGMLLHRKNDSREASSRSLIR